MIEHIETRIPSGLIVAVVKLERVYELVKRAHVMVVLVGGIAHIPHTKRPIVAVYERNALVALVRATRGTLANAPPRCLQLIFKSAVIHGSSILSGIAHTITLVSA
jgi:hypothetical protein